MNLRRAAALTIITAALTLAGCGGTTSSGRTVVPAVTTSSSAAPAIANAAVGAGFSFTGPGEGTVVVHTATWQPATPGNLSSPAKNGAYLVADVEYTVDTGTGSIFEFDWKFQDSQARRWDCTSGFYFKPDLTSARLTGPDKVRGNIACDAPQGAGVLNWTPGFGDAVPFRWDITS